MANGKGLKAEWKVGDPSAGSADAQSKDFRGDFKKKMDAVDANLTYLAGNGDLEDHLSLSKAQADIFTDYQKIAKAAGKTAPAKLEKAREVVLERAEKLRKKAKKTETETEAARQAWLRSETLREEKAKQVYELEVWGSPEAARLLKGTQIIEWHYAGRRKWAEANKFIAQLKEQVEPLHADYLLQKAAKDTYERERQSFDGHYEPAQALPYPSGPMSDLIDELDEMVPLIDAEVGNLDFIKAREQLRATAEKLAELLKLDTRTERQQYMDGVNDLLEELDQALAETAPTTDLKDIKDKIDPLRQQMEQAAKDGDYGKALKLFFELKKLVTDFNEGCEAWTTAKSGYETALAAIKANLDRALAAPAPIDELKEPKDAIVAVKDDLDKAVTDLDYPLALDHVQDLSAKLKPFIALLDKHEEAERKYLAEEPGLRPDVNKSLGLSPTDPEIKARVVQIAEIDLEMRTRAKDLDFVVAYSIYGQLKPRVEEILDHDEDLQSRKDYETALPAVQDKLTQVRESTYLEEFADKRAAVEKAAAQMEGAVAGLNFALAVEKLAEVADLADAYLDAAKDKEEKNQEMIANVRSLMDGTDYFTADDMARQIVGKLSDEELSYLPMDLRNRLMEEMKGGFKSEEDITALNKLTAIPPAGSGPMDKETAALIKRVEAALNSANWLTEDDKARQEIEALTQDDLGKLPDELRARVRKALEDGYESYEDAKALRTLDLTDKIAAAEELIAQIENLDLSIMKRKGKAFVQEKLKEIKSLVKEAKAEIDADAFDAAEALLDEAAAVGQGVMAKIQLHTGFPDPEAIKNLAAGPNGQKVLDEVIASMPDSVSQRAMEVAIEERFGMQLDLMDKELDWEELADKDDKSLKHIYQMMAKLPPDHILGNEELDLIERFSEVTDEGGTYYGDDDDTIVLECGRVDPKDTEDLGLDGEPVDPDCAPDPALGTAPAFSFTLLHEIGHSVDDKAKWMQANGKSKKNGGWINYNSDCSKVADLITKKFGCDLAYVKKVLQSKEPGDYPDPPSGVDPAKWEKGRNDAEVWCKAIRRDGELWDSGMARTYQIGGRVYQQSYSSDEDGYDEWVSYSLSARNQGFTTYQFRAPGEWFSELYAAYHSKVLPPKHPAAVWLKELDKPMK